MALSERSTVGEGSVVGAEDDRRPRGQRQAYSTSARDVNIGAAARGRGAGARPLPSRGISGTLQAGTDPDRITPTP